MNRTVIGIDVGGTTTKIVGFRKQSGAEPELISPQFVRATDPLTSVYGAFGKFTSENRLELSDIDKILMTGAGSSIVQNNIYNLKCLPVSEFTSIGIGGLYLSGLKEAIVVSMGTGTALIHAKKEPSGKHKVEYLGGTGMGGGTLVGLSRKMIGVDNVEHIEQLCHEGDLSKIDLRIKDISHKNAYQGVNENLTAANFGNVSDFATKSDVALGIANMIAETVAMLSIFAARSYGLRDIVLTGNLAALDSFKKVFDGLAQSFGFRFLIPENAPFATVIGAALIE